MFETCVETVSILYAMIFGAGDACINLGAGSVFGALAAFMAVVVAAQYMARKLWKRIVSPQRRGQRIGAISDEAPTAEDKFKDSAVWSRKR